MHHVCNTKLSLPCFKCGEMIPPPSYCSVCGVDVSSPHICQPKPQIHRCIVQMSSRTCRHCQMPLPITQYCRSCGMDITEPHVCRSKDYSQVPTRSFKPVHVCRNVFRVETCIACGLPLPPPAYCASCGSDISSQHVCKPISPVHHCAPRIAVGTCLNCNLPLPIPYFCRSCGKDISEPHKCSMQFRH